MKSEILVCCGTGCIANGSVVLLEELKRELVAEGAAAAVTAVTKHTGCNGFCENGPILRLMPQDISYYRVQKEDAPEIVRALM